MHIHVETYILLSSLFSRVASVKCATKSAMGEVGAGLPRSARALATVRDDMHARAAAKVLYRTFVQPGLQAIGLMIQTLMYFLAK